MNQRPSGESLLHASLLSRRPWMQLFTLRQRNCGGRLSRRFLRYL